jgi:hypothetical protein
MGHRTAPRPHMWRVYVQTLLPDVTSEPVCAAAARPARRRTREQRLRRDRAQPAHPPAFAARKNF